MIRYKIFTLYTLIVVSLLSCRGYVEKVPVQGQRVLVYTEDYRLLMNHSDILDVALGFAPALSCDDIDATAAQMENRISQNQIQTAMYTWSKPFYLGETTDNDWSKLYGGMYVYNTVINGVLESKGGDVSTKNNILAEALVHRAFTYFMLVNMYGKQYDAATSEKDPGVPLILKPTLLGELHRSSVKQTYDQILIDIRRAIPLLSSTPPTVNFRPGRAAAYALLSKVHLNMRNFEEAKAFADSTLAISSSLYDYKKSVENAPNYVFPTQYNENQIILRKIPRISHSPYQLSQPLLDLLGTKDLRYELFVRPGTSLNPAFTGFGFWARQNYSGYPDAPAVGLSVNDTWLIKAECLARDKKKDEAVAMLNTLRKLRFKAIDYVDLSASTLEEALQMVIDERRREFFGSGLRWFDQRRLNKDPMFAKTVTRVFNNVTYKLEPNSDGYVFPLATILINQNPELGKNP